MSILESIEKNEQLERWIKENIEWLSLLHDLHKQRKQDEEESTDTSKNRPPNCS
jgi:hypothetical protein